MNDSLMIDYTNAKYVFLAFVIVSLLSAFISYLIGILESKIRKGK